MMTKIEKIKELKKLLSLALEICEPDHECSKCTVADKCKESYRKILEKEMDEDMLDKLDEFCYPMMDDNQEDCLIRKQIRAIIEK